MPYDKYLQIFVFGRWGSVTFNVIGYRIGKQPFTSDRDSFILHESIFLQIWVKKQDKVGTFCLGWQPISEKKKLNSQPTWRVLGTVGIIGAKHYCNCWRNCHPNKLNMLLNLGYRFYICENVKIWRQSLRTQRTAVVMILSNCCSKANINNYYDYLVDFIRMTTILGINFNGRSLALINVCGVSKENCLVN